MKSQIEKELDIKKRKEQAKLIIFLMYVLIIFFAVIIIFEFIISELSLYWTISYIGIIAIFFLLLHYVHKNFFKYVIHVMEFRNRWSEQSIEVDIAYKALYAVIGIILIVLLSQVFQKGLSFDIIIFLPLLLFMVWLLYSAKRFGKKLEFWESKLYHDLDFDETLRKIESGLIKNNLKYHKIENKGRKFFTFDRYDYLFELPNNIQLKLFFPIKRKGKFNLILRCYIQLGPIDNSKKVDLTIYKRLLDSVLEED